MTTVAQPKQQPQASCAMLLCCSDRCPVARSAYRKHDIVATGASKCMPHWQHQAQHPTGIRQIDQLSPRREALSLPNSATQQSTVLTGSKHLTQQSTVLTGSKLLTQQSTVLTGSKQLTQGSVLTNSKGCPNRTARLDFTIYPFQASCLHGRNS
jgi:hypothetical protein